MNGEDIEAQFVRNLDKALRSEAGAKAVLMEREQRKISREYGTNRKALDGIGAPVAEIHPESYHEWGQRLGYECWKDKQFVAEFLRDNPHARVKAVGTKTQVGYVPSNPKFSKTYATT